MRARFLVPARERLRRGTRQDVPFVRDVAGAVFSHLGDYATILPLWLLHDGVRTQILERGDELVGFTMLGFYERAELTLPPVHRARRATTDLVADLLAIAVAPHAQSCGYGRRLLDDAIARVKKARRRLRLTELRLSVADVNLRARRLFDSAGFRRIDGDDGLYDGGQTALHLTLMLD